MLVNLWGRGRIGAFVVRGLQEDPEARLAGPHLTKITDEMGNGYIQRVSASLFIGGYENTAVKPLHKLISHCYGVLMPRLGDSKRHRAGDALRQRIRSVFENVPFYLADPRTLAWYDTSKPQSTQELEPLPAQD